MTDDEKRPPEGPPPENGGAAPAPTNANGTANHQNKASTSNYNPSWRTVSLRSSADGKTRGLIDQVLDVVGRSYALRGERVPAPDVAYPAIVDVLMQWCVRGQSAPANRREFLNLLDLCHHGHVTETLQSFEEVPVLSGYTSRYSAQVDENSHLTRVPVDAVAYAMASYDAWAYEAVGLRQVVVKGSESIAEYSPSCNYDDSAPYSVKTGRELEGQVRRWGRHIGQRQLKRYLSHLRGLLPEVDFTERLDPMECPVANGMLRRDYTGGHVTLTVRPYTVEDFRLGKYSGLRFETDANGEVIPPEEPVFRRNGRPDWRPGEWFRDAMPDENGRRALLAVLILLMFPAVNIEKAIVFYGLGRNGKGTFLAMMRAMVGSREFQQRYLASVGIEKLANEYYLARLVGKLANLVDETDATYLKHMASAKAAIGGDVVTGRDPYGKAKEFVAKMLFVYCLNTELTTAEQTEAIINRFAFITFPSSFFDRPGGIDRRIKEDFMQRPEVCTWFAFQALTQVPYFETSAIIDENPYVVASNAENLAEANPTIRAWRLLREEVETRTENGEAKWAQVRAMPVYVAHALMSAAKERYEGETGKLPRSTGRTFRQNLERAAKADGFRIVRNEDGNPKQLPMRDWWDEDAMAPLVEAFGGDDLKTWVKDHAGARPRAWLVRDYAGPGSSPRARKADDAEAEGVGDGIRYGVAVAVPRETRAQWYDAKLRREYGRFVGNIMAASLAPDGYEVWLAPWRARPSLPQSARRSLAGDELLPPEVIRPRGLAVYDDLDTPPREWLRDNPWRAPVVERRVSEGATSFEATSILRAAVDVMRHHPARVCVTVPRGVVALPGFDVWRALNDDMSAHDAGQNAGIGTWTVQPVLRRALPPAGERADGGSLTALVGRTAVAELLRQDPPIADSALSALARVAGPDGLPPCDDEALGTALREATVAQLVGACGSLPTGDKTTLARALDRIAEARAANEKND